ncbi:hypothetical protein [Sediminitomix flava]|uniref:Septum formation inhibitor Maf n=1 Tax=Sediminitomix flava TaxID=379075 RepID=A0A315ZFJ6_SEDFL|nr:hypothetical protein [Sediminitomix flava]PWJ43920.1 hypothetical protein BC781_101270 [Sediminitomix flava]
MSVKVLTPFILVFLWACSQQSSEHVKQEPILEPSTSFNTYWYNSKAEITSYHLEQPRYGEYRSGNAVLIFVTEPFSKTRFVKLDQPDKKDGVSVLKCNLMKNFDTGIYPYSLMQSVFTPVTSYQIPASLKLTLSNQEWCGQYFTSIMNQDDYLSYFSQSYFEGEELIKKKMPKYLLEDEVWNIIRINPDELPEGDQMVIPSMLTQQMRHKELKAEKATLSLFQNPQDSSLYTYRIVYHSINRELKIHFKSAFPHEIQSWEETFISGNGKNAQPMTAKATLNKRMMVDYWNKNRNEDAYLRGSEGLNIDKSQNIEFPSVLNGTLEQKTHQSNFIKFPDSQSSEKSPLK